MTHRIATYEKNIEAKINEYRSKMKELSREQYLRESDLFRLASEYPPLADMLEQENWISKVLPIVNIYHDIKRDINLIKEKKELYLTFIEDLWSLEDKEVDSE